VLVHSEIQDRQQRKEKEEMIKEKSIKSTACILALCLSLALGAGCATKAQTGALAGASTGALIGGLANMHGSWGATALLGAGVGAGVGYLIGNEQDRRDAERRREVTAAELRPLVGTRWRVVSIEPEPQRPYKSIVSRFMYNGTVITTQTAMSGKRHRTVEKYRVVGSTLILSRPDYVENARFSIEGDRLTIDYGNGSTILQRISDR
jgi:hypothetical protein